MTHSPRFHLKRKGNEIWLYDNEESVLCFDREKVVFGHGRLTPGGMEMFPRPEMHWSGGGMLKPYWGNTIKKMKRDVRLFKTKVTPQKASFRIVTRMEGGVVESDWRMDVTYDQEFRSYVYDIVTSALVFKKPDPATYNPVEFEYFDLYTNGMLPSSTAFQFYRDGKHVPMPGPLWDYLVYEKDIDYYGSNRYWVKAPLNHLITSAQNNVRVRHDGFVGMMNNPAGNPMVQLMGDTAELTRVDTCNWFYDLHFNHPFRLTKTPPPRGFSTSMHFRILSFDNARSRAVMEDAQLAVLPEAERASKMYPRYEPEGVNSFEHAISMDHGDHSKVWRPFHKHPLYVNFGLCDVRIHGDGQKHAVWKNNFTNPHARCLWERNYGRTGFSSLKVASEKSAVAGWNLPLFEAPQVEPDRKYRLSVWIKTEDLQGKGASLGCCLTPYTNPWALVEPNKQYEYKPLFASKRVKGSADWTKVELITPVMENARYSECFGDELRMCAIQPILWHEGKGISWFDDFILESI